MTAAESRQRVAHHQHGNVVTTQIAGIEPLAFDPLTLLKTQQIAVMNAIEAGGFRGAFQQPPQAGATGLGDVHQQQTTHGASIQAWGVGSSKRSISSQLEINCGRGSGLIRRC